MAACSLFEDDEVCHVTPDNTYVYGLVIENSESLSSDEEDSRQDICKKGCVRVAWHPRGKESFNTPENKVLLADRSLMVADVVRRFVPGQETQCGTVQDLQVTCHLHVTGTDKYIYNIDSKLLSPCIQLQRYDNGYVTLDNWLGRVEEVTQTITLLLPDGARCEVLDVEVAPNLTDITDKRPETGTFSEEYWYPGQQLKGDMGCLYNATWLHSTLLHNPKNVQSKRHNTIHAVVQQVKLRTVDVYWICCGYSKVSMASASDTMPSNTVEGDDLQRLQLVDWFEHCCVKLGDKMYYTISPEDVLHTQPPTHRTPHVAQHLSPQQLDQVTHRTHDLYKQRFEEAGRPRRKGSRKGAVSASSSNATTTTATLSADSLLDSDVTMETEATAAEINAPCAEAAPEPKDKERGESPCQTLGEKEGGDVDGEIEADDEYEDVEEGDGGDSDDSESSAPSATKQLRSERVLPVSVKSLRHSSRSRTTRRARVVAEMVTPGSRVATEVCYTYSIATVMWQDGSVEKIPSVDLFPVHHMDELEYFPGTFVVDAAASSTSNEYGVVTSSNRFERTCKIQWFKPYQVGQGTFPTEVIKESEMSVYDIHDHPDYKFRPGNSVIRVAGFEDTEQTLQAVGQVVRLDPSGCVFVHWSDGSFTSSYPQDLYIVWDMSDYSNSSSDLDSTETDSFGSSDSWETEEEWKGFDEEGADDSAMEEESEDKLKARKMSRDQLKELRELMGKIKTCFQTISDSYVSFSLFEKCSEIVQDLAAISPCIVPTIKRALRLYRWWFKSAKRWSVGAAAFSDTQILQLVTRLECELKREKCNRIKQHLAHVFESTNKGLLESTKNGADAHATSSSRSSLGGVDREGRVVDSLAMASPNKKIKTEEVGTPVDVDVGSSVDACPDPGPLQNGLPSHDVETDIACRLAATNVAETKDDQVFSLEALLAQNPAHEGLVTVEDMVMLKSHWDTINSNLDTVHNLMTLAEDCAKEGGGGEDKEEEVKEKKDEEVKNKKDNGSLSPKPLAIHNGVYGETEVMSGGEGEGGTTADKQETEVGASVDTVAINGDEEEEEAIVDPPGVLLHQGFEMCGSAPACHRYITKTCLPSQPKSFHAALRRELKLLRSSLPQGIIIKGFEDRMDLFSVLIDGPSDTPYEDGVFMFEVMLPGDYPTSPPLLHYLSFAPDRLNPNLYVDGKVCISLLGTWSGKGMEVWTDQSNLLQVLVSIQGLILVAEPYYNEAGYERQRGQQIALENSRMYNEIALLKLVESMTAMCENPPKPFIEEVHQRLRTNGPRMVSRLRRWVSLSESMGERQQLVTAPKAISVAELSAPTHDSSNVNTTNSTTMNATQPQTCLLSENQTNLHQSPGQDNHSRYQPSSQPSSQLTNQPVSQPSFSPEAVKDDQHSNLLTNQSSSLPEVEKDNRPSSQPSNQPSSQPASQPAGHPSFPLLPMSRGFRLTLRKSLSQLETALNDLLTSGQQGGDVTHTSTS